MMNRWTNKYSYGPGGVANTPARVLGGKLRSVLLVLLVAAVVVLGVVGGRAIVYQSRCEPTFVHRMQTECKEAINVLPSLSRSRGGSADDAANLGKVRSNIRAMEAINEVSNTVAGGNGYLVPTATFTELYTIINSYYSNLKLGQEIVADWDKLDTALTNLSTLLAGLE